MLTDFNLGLAALSEHTDPKAVREYTKIYATLQSMANVIFPSSISSTETDRSKIGLSRLDMHRYSTLFVKAGEDVGNRVCVQFVGIDGEIRVFSGDYGDLRAYHGVTLLAASAGEYVPVCMYGIVGGFTGLEPCVTYGTRGDSGALAPITNVDMSADPNFQRVGIALSETQLFVGAVPGAHYDAVWISDL